MGVLEFGSHVTRKVQGIYIYILSYEGHTKAGHSAGDTEANCKIRGNENAE